jgi:hypothetical protein
MPTVLPEPTEDKRDLIPRSIRMRGYGGPPKRRFAHPADGIDDEVRFLLYSLQRSADLQAQAVGQFADAFDSAL